MTSGKKKRKMRIITQDNIDRRKSEPGIDVDRLQCEPHAVQEVVLSFHVVLHIVTTHDGRGVLGKCSNIR